MNPRLRRLPRLRDLPSIAGVAVARALVRRGVDRGSGFVSSETPVIITGMHRSGTSIIARLLERGGMYLGESLGQIGISLIFILILLFRPTGLFGARQ